MTEQFYVKTCGGTAPGNSQKTRRELALPPPDEFLWQCVSSTPLTNPVTGRK